MRRVGAAVTAATVVSVALALSLNGSDGGTREAGSGSRSLIERLEARPLELDDVAPGRPCPLSNVRALPGVPTEGGLGPGSATGDDGLRRLARGPVYLAFSAIPRVLDVLLPRGTDPGARWGSAEVLWVSRPPYGGPVVVRGRRLDGMGEVRFGEGRRPRRTLRLTQARWGPPGKQLSVWERTADPEPGWRMAATTVRMRRTGCYGVQVDGRGFSYRLAFQASVYSPRPR